MVENTLHLGLCLPKSCRKDQIHFLVQIFLNNSEGAYEFGPQSSVLRVKDLKFNPRFLLKKTLLSFIVLCISIAYLRRVAKKMEKNEMMDSNNNSVQTPENDLNLSLIEKLIKCFGSRQKLEITNENSASVTVKSISGLRYVVLAQAVRFQNITCFQIHFMLLNCNYACLSFLSLFAA